MAAEDQLIYGFYELPLVTFFCFRADAGHDYKTIACQGFRHLVVKKEDRPAVIENPRWKTLANDE